jgi:hypothetical protein
MPRRLNSESFFYLNVRSRFNQKTRGTIPASPLSARPATAHFRPGRTTIRALAALLTLGTIISQAAAQTQPQPGPAPTNVATGAGAGTAAAVPPPKTPPATTTNKPATVASPATDSSASTTLPPPNPTPTAAPAVSTPTPAVAAPTPTAEQVAAASTALAAAQQAYAKGEYQLAEQQYKTAFAAVPSAQAELGIAASVDLQAKPTEAHDAYTRLLARPDLDQLPPAEVTHARERVSVLAQIPAVVRLAVISKDQLVSGAKILLDGSEQNALELQLKAGSHRLQVLATGYHDYEQTLTVKPAQVLDLPVELEAVPARPVVETPPAIETPADPVPAPELPSKAPAYITLGVAGGAAIAGAIFGVKALSAEDRFDKSPTIAHADDVERNALIADMAFGVAFTLGITGIVLLLTDEPTEPGAAPEAQTALQVVPFVSRDRGGAVAQLTF